MKSNLYIPKKIRVGFRNSLETSTGKFACIIGFDERGVLRKENSWDNWRDKNIPYIDLDNNPIEGFLFNKDFNEEVLNHEPFLLIKHPNEFEFEISTGNLICLLLRSTISKKLINGKCIFALDEYNNLNLIPVDSFEYRKAINDTEKLLNNFSTKNLKKGFKYSLKKSNEELTYLGYFNFFKYSYFDFSSIITQKNLSKSSKKHVFYDKKGNFSTPSISTLVSCVSDTIANDYEKNLDVFFKSKYSNKLNTLFIGEPEVRINENCSDLIFKDYGKEKMSSIGFDFVKKQIISFNKDNNAIAGLTFYLYELGLNGYSSINYKTTRTSSEINEFLSIFPEIIERDIPLNDFLTMAKERGFKSIYLRTEVEDSIKYRL